MSGSFSMVIGVLLSGVIAVSVIAATYVLCVRPVLTARSHGGDRRRGELGAGPDRNPELDRQLVERPAELDALRAHQPHGRSEISTDPKRL